MQGRDRCRNNCRYVADAASIRSTFFYRVGYDRLDTTVNAAPVLTLLRRRCRNGHSGWNLRSLAVGLGLGALAHNHAFESRFLDGFRHPLQLLLGDDPTARRLHTPTAFTAAGEFATAWARAARRSPTTAGKTDVFRFHHKLCGRRFFDVWNNTAGLGLTGRATAPPDQTDHRQQGQNV